MAVNLGMVAGANRSPLVPPTLVSAGDEFSLYTSQSGVGYAWGRQGFGGDLGDNTTTDRSSRVAVCGGLTFSSLSANPHGGGFGLGFSLGLTKTGVAYAWGLNSNQQLGDNTSTNRSTPVAVCAGFGGLTFSQLSAGGFHSLGVTTTGVGYAWGNNTNGRLGDNTTTQRGTPVAICGGLTFSQVSAGGGHSLGITTAGVAYAWGSGSQGQIGNNAANITNATPVAVCGGLTFKQVSAGELFSLGITTTGIAYAWGRNANGQLGDNTTFQRNAPVAVCGGLTFAQISAGSNFSLGITTTGVAYAWGANTDGQLGDNTTTQRNTPVAVCGGLTFSQISAGWNHSLGVTTSGIVYAWGANAYGQLGDTTTTKRSTPVAVCGLA